MPHANDDTFFGRPENELRSALTQRFDELRAMVARGRLDGQLVDDAIKRATEDAGNGEFESAFTHVTGAFWPE